MLNNKGFAVSTVLYTLLIAFLLFLGATLAMFSSSNSIISNANNDLINGTKFEAIQVKSVEACTGEDTTKIPWYKTKNDDGNVEISNTIVRIKTRYGTMYWPKDFTVDSENEDNNITINLTDVDVLKSGNQNGKITVEKGTSSSDLFELTFKDTVTEVETTVTIGDICG